MALVHLVEDDPIIRQTVEYALKRAGFATASYDNGKDGLDAALSQRPDLILLDLMLPGIDGYSFAERVRAEDGEVAIIMVTALSEDRDKVRGLDAGADDYVAKPFSMEELLARVRANLRRVRERAVLGKSEKIEHADLLIEPSEIRASAAGHTLQLRLKEFQLLLALASNPGRVMTRQTLASEVWGYDFLPSSRTIDVHIRRLRQALEETSEYDFVHTVHGVGYRFEPVKRSVEE